MLKTLNTGIFPLTVYTSTKASDFKKIDNEIVEIHFNDSYDAKTVRLPHGDVFIHFKAKPTPSLVAHELFHAVEFVLEFVGISHCKESSEVYAYLIQHLTKQYYE